LPSIVSALSGAERVVVTDYPGDEAERNMAYNLDINMEDDIRKTSVVAVGTVIGSADSRGMSGEGMSGHYEAC
jgi:predicted nicotinamide N-methyase